MSDASSVSLSEIEASARAIFEQQPFSRFIGATLVGVTAQTVVLSLEIRPEHLQQHGYVHGGVLSYLADNAITFAGGVALRGDAVTSEYKINYLRPARGTTLVARGTARGAGRQQAVCTCEVFMVRGTGEVLCAIAQGTVVAMPARVEGKGKA